MKTPARLTEPRPRPAAIRTAVVRLALCLSLALPLTTPLPARAGPGSDPGPEVDLQLVLAADASGSMNAALARAQRQAFADAFRSSGVARAVGAGPSGRIAVIYFEWSGPHTQRIVVPWTILSTPDDMDRFAAALLDAPAGVTGGDTSISGALLFARNRIADSGLTSPRQVIDVSSNGRNNAGPALDTLRPALCGGRLTVNAVALPPAHAPGDYDAAFVGYHGELNDYYRTVLACGPGAFVETVQDWNMAGAILRKLVFEIAWLR